MAQIDSSIYFKQEAPDIMGSVQKGMSMRDMLNERDKKNKIAEAYKGATTQNPDGTVSFDQKKVASNLFGAGFGQEAFDAQEKSQQSEMAKQKMSREALTQKTSDIARYAGAALSNPQSWSQIRAEVISKGLAKETDLPQQFDENFVKRQHYMALTAQEQLAQQNKDRELELRKQELGIKRAEAGDKNKKNSGAIEGRKTLDKEFAKDYNEWTSGGAKRSREEINKIEGVVQRLRDKKGTTGGLTGVFGDRITSDDVLKNRADVQQSAMSLIKTLLSGATSDKDREQIVNTLWNEADSTENNIARLERFAKDMKSRADDTDAKSIFYEQNQSLAGYKGIGNQLKDSPRNPPGQKQTKLVQVKAPSGKIVNVPENEVDQVVRGGGKVVEMKAGM